MRELTMLRKNKAEFEMVGNVKLSDFTFKMEQESQKSDWIYNSLNLGIDCGINGTYYASMMGGYGSQRKNLLYVHGTKEENGKMRDDFNNRFTIDFDDRFEKEILDTIGSMRFINVGIVDDGEKIIFEKFLSEYDAITYLEGNLRDGMKVKVKGNLSYREYEGQVTVQKNINKIYLVPEETPCKATFTQAILLDKDAIGKLDKETNTIPLTVSVIENIREYAGQPIRRMVNGKTVKSVNLPLIKTMNFNVGEDVEKAKKMLKQFKVKSNKFVTQLVVEGHFSRGAINTVEVTMDDLDEDIKEMIELGFLDKDEILGQIAKANGSGNSPETMIIDKPCIKFVGKDDKKIPSIDKVIDIYTLDDINVEYILEDCFGDEQPKQEELEVDEDKALDSLLDKDTDSDDDDWLNDL